VGVKLLKGQVRILKSNLENEIGQQIPVRHPLMAWLASHAAALVTWCTKGHDGRTAYQKVRGKEFRTRLLAVGEACRFKNRSHEPLKASVENRRFHAGIFIGIDRRTGQHILHNGSEVKLARTIMRMFGTEKWDKEALVKIGCTPYDMHQPREPEVIFREKNDEQIANPKELISMARQVYIKPKDLERYGLTRKCKKCDHERAYCPGRTSAAHSKVCRVRIMKELAKTEEGQARIAAAAVRLDMTVSELGQQHRADVPKGKIEPVVQHQQLDSPPIFLPMTESETIKPPKCESGEALSPADDDRLVETYRNREESNRHGILDMGFEEGKPQELPGMEVDVITAEDCDLKDLMNTMTRKAKEEILTVNREIMSVVQALGGKPAEVQKGAIPRCESDRVRYIFSSGGDSRDQAVAGVEAHFKIRSGFDYC
jgi:hypothetical protein